MKRYKRLYIVSLILIAVVLTSVYFSYAFFANKNEQHGKLNVVVGDLKYKLESNDLVNNSITISAGETKEITLTLTSLNNISSKYEIYYNLTNSNNVEVGYLNVPASGTIGANEVINIEVGIKNKGTSSTIVTFGLEKGLTNNQLVINDGTSLNQIEICRYNQGTTWNFDYTGSEQEFKVPCSGTYKLETWGAQGGDSYSYGGYGAYAYGSLKTLKNTNFYIQVGGYPGTTFNAGYNGGGTGVLSDGAKFWYNGGGGATHIAGVSGILSKLSGSVNDIFLVAAGGSGSSRYINVNQSGVSGGGIQSPKSLYVNGGISHNSLIDGINQNNIISNPNADGKFSCTSSSDMRDVEITYGTFGQGSSGAGGGLYGGVRLGGCNIIYSGGGGVSYIGNVKLMDKAMYCYNCPTSNEVSTKTVSTTCHSSNPTVNCAKEGNGYARITLVSID